MGCVAAPVLLTDRLPNVVNEFDSINFSLNSYTQAPTLTRADQIGKAKGGP